MNMTLLRKQKGDGIAVIVYGVTLMLVFTFLAINLLNGKIIENGYNSLRDSIQSATTGSVIHLLTSTDNVTGAQGDVLNQSDNVSAKNTAKEFAVQKYDIYLQLALGYIINRDLEPEDVADAREDNVIVQTGTINNFIKLDHKKVVNSTLALLQDSVIRGKQDNDVRTPLNIHDTDYFKILMIFIEPYYTTESEKYFNLIVYGNGAEDFDANGTPIGQTYIAGSDSGDMKKVYDNLNKVLSEWIVNADDPLKGAGSTRYRLQDAYGRKMKLNISLTDGNSQENPEALMRKMETKPYYLVVVKDFALPTLFRSTYTNAENDKNVFRDAFEAISGDGRLKTPIVALNAANVERKLGGSDR